MSFGCRAHATSTSLNAFDLETETAKRMTSEATTFPVAFLKAKSGCRLTRQLVVRTLHAETRKTTGLITFLIPRNRKAAYV